MKTNMTFDELKELEVNSSAIKKIDRFINEAKSDSTDFFNAIKLKSEYLSKLNKEDDAFKMLFQYAKNLNSYPDENAVILLDAIISLSLECNMLNQAKKYIDLKKYRLKSYEKNKYLKDIILYNIGSKDFNEATRNILVYLNDDISEDDRIFALELLVKFYIKNKEFDKFDDVKEKLIDIYQKRLDFVSINNLNCRSLEIVFDGGNYNKLISDAKTLLNESHLTNNQFLIISTLLIRSYIALNDTRKAMICESEYEAYLEGADIILQEKFCKACLDLFKNINSKVSIDIYQNRLNDLKQQSRKNEKANKKIKKKFVDIEEEQEEKVEEIVLAVAPKKVPRIEEVVTHVAISPAFEKLKQVFVATNNVDKKALYREVFRLSMIALQHEYPIDEAVFIYYSQKYIGYHYKVERVYGKEFDFEALFNTINMQCITEESAIISDNLAEEEFNKNIITGNLYDQDTKAFSIPLYLENEVFGSLTFYSSKRFIDLDFAYECLMYLTMMLNSRLVAEIERVEEIHLHEKMDFILSNMTSGLKEDTDGFIHLSMQAAKMLNQDSDLNNSTYESLIDSFDVQAYRDSRDMALKQMKSDVEVTYHMDIQGTKHTIKERFYPMLTKGMIRLISIIDDISIYENTSNELKELAYLNPISKLPTQLKLYMDLETEIETQKYIFALISINDFKLYYDLYGYSFQSQLLIAVANEAKKLLEDKFNSSIYQMNNDTIGLLIRNVNDKRLAQSLIEDFLKKLQTEVNKLNYRIKISFSAGVYRATKNQGATDANKVLFYASEGLIDAKELKDGANHVAIYNQVNYKKRFFESQLITHISECIDHNKMAITYQQVIDIRSSSVSQYKAKLNLVNYDCPSDIMNSTIEKRGLEDLLDKYLFQHVLMELKDFRDSVKSFVKVIIPMHKKTITAPDFYDFVLKQINFFKIYGDSITIEIVDDETNINLDLIHKKLKEIGISLSSDNFKYFYLKQIDELYFDIQTFDLEVLNDIKEFAERNNIEIIAYNVDSKEELAHAKAYGLDIIVGNLFKQQIKMKSLIEKIKEK